MKKSLAVEISKMLEESDPRVIAQPAYGLDGSCFLTVRWAGAPEDQSRLGEYESIDKMLEDRRFSALHEKLREMVVSAS